MQRSPAHVHSQGKQRRKAAQPEENVEQRIGFQASAQDAEEIVYKPYAHAHGRRTEKLKKLVGYIKLHLSEKL